MGFSPQQARLALAATDTGLDVQQALEMLLSNGATGEGGEADAPAAIFLASENSGFRDDDDEEQSASPPRPPPSHSRRQPPDRGSPLAGGSRRNIQTPPLASGEFQDKADKLLAQASEIGLNMFNRANALFKDGKVKVQRAYEERAAKAKPPTDGRPRWMISQTTSEEFESNDHPLRKFRDTNGIGKDGETPIRQQRADSNLSPVQPAPRPTPANPVNLFDNGPAVYVSPARRRPVISRSGSQGPSSPAPAAAQAPSPQMQPPSAPPKPSRKTRATVPASASAINASNAHKAKGTEKFKLGQFAEAEQAYSAALSQLPSNHLLVAPLLNNRALCRIKIGEHGGAIEDCTAVLSIIGKDYDPALEEKVMKEDEGASVDLADAYIKAYRRRAEAFEGREKWDSAQSDWEAITRCSWSLKMRADAQSGVARCRKMTTVESEPRKYSFVRFQMLFSADTKTTRSGENAPEGTAANYFDDSS